MATPTDLARGFADWVGPRIPRDNWEPSVRKMRILLVDYLAGRYPTEARPRLDELAREHVTVDDKRLSVDMVAIARGLAN